MYTCHSFNMDLCKFPQIFRNIAAVFRLSRRISNLNTSHQLSRFQWSFCRRNQIHPGIIGTTSWQILYFFSDNPLNSIELILSRKFRVTCNAMHLGATLGRNIIAAACHLMLGGSKQNPSSLAAWSGGITDEPMDLGVHSFKKLPSKRKLRDLWVTNNGRAFIFSIHWTWAENVGYMRLDAIWMMSLKVVCYTNSDNSLADCGGVE